MGIMAVLANDANNIQDDDVNFRPMSESTFQFPMYRDDDNLLIVIKCDDGGWMVA
jgi:hypothetical protein